MNECKKGITQESKLGVWVELKHVHLCTITNKLTNSILSWLHEGSEQQ